MLTKQDNELLCRVGPGTPMGRMMREYWVPALLSEEMPDPDGAPVRVRLLGEDLIAWRNTDNSVGLMQNACPHRGASMFWTYMGPQATTPGMTEFEWNMDENARPFLWMNYRECNWLQAIEGGIDTSHVNFLHRTLDETLRSTAVNSGPSPRQANDLFKYGRRDSSPALEVVDTDYGVLYTGRRSVDDNTDYHRIHPFIFPFHNMIGGGTQEDEVNYIGMVWTPIDDENTLVLEYGYRPSRPWGEEEIKQLMKVRNPTGFLPPTTEPGGRWKFRANKTNDYMVDYELQKTKLFFGVLSNPLQDGAVQESMGPIYDRGKEHLGTTDAMIIRVRRRLLEAVKAYRDRGELPPGVNNPSMYAIRPVGAILAKGADWVAETETRRKAWYAPANA